MSDDRRTPFDAARSGVREQLRSELNRNAHHLAHGRPTEDLQRWQPSLQDKIESLGFAGDASRAFDLLPLVLVAWADGTIQREERAKILDLLHLRSMAGTQAFTTIEALLETRPADVYLEAALDLLRELVAASADGGASVVDLCISVAAAASDHIGSPDPISESERDAIAHIADVLGERAVSELHKQLDARA